VALRSATIADSSHRVYPLATAAPRRSDTADEQTIRAFLQGAIFDGGAQRQSREGSPSRQASAPKDDADPHAVRVLEWEKVVTSLCRQDHTAKLVNSPTRPVVLSPLLLSPLPITPISPPPRAQGRREVGEGTSMALRPFRAVNDLYLMSSLNFRTSSARSALRPPRADHGDNPRLSRRQWLWRE